MSEEERPPESESEPNADETVMMPEGGSGNQVIGEYEILGKLGQGGMGAVYRARQMSLDRQVALKILPNNLEADDEFVARFQREARMAASLSHQNIVKVFASGQADGSHYIAMELVEGETLGQFLKRSGALEPTDALRVTRDVALALQYGWAKAQLIHRDIKPGNIFLSENGEVKVGDLGLAKSMAGDTTGLTQTGTAMGTPHYISPEQSRGEKDIDFRADIYSLGCTLYQMLTGRTPYSGSDPVVVLSQHRDAPPPALLKVMPQAPIPLARLVGKMLKKAKRERQASYEELIAEIAKVQALYAPAEDATLSAILPTDPDATMLEAPTPTPGSSKHRPPTAATAVLVKTKSRVPLYAAIAVGMLALGGAAVFLTGKKKEPEKLSKAEIAMRARETTEKEKPVAVAAGWQPLFSPGEWEALGRTHEMKDGLLHVRGKQVGRPLPDPDGAIRARARIREGTFGPSVFLRAGAQGTYKFGLATPTLAKLNYYAPGAAAGDPLGTAELPQAFQNEEIVTLELRAEGDRLVARINDATVIDVRDGRIAGAGNWGIHPADGWYESVEVQAAAASALPAAAIRLSDTAENLSPVKGMTWENGVIHLEKAGQRFIGAPKRNGIFRAAVRTDENGCQIALRFSKSPQSGKLVAYALSVRPKAQTLVLSYQDGGPSETLQSWRLPRPYGPDEWVRVELRAIGEELTVVLEDKVLGTVRDRRITEAGNLDLWSPGSSDFRDVEYVPLDGGGATTAPASGSSPWQPLFTAAEWQAPGDRRQWQDGLLHLTAYGAWTRPMTSPNGSLRARIQYQDGNDTALAARSNPGKGNYKLTVFNGKALGLSYSAPEAGSKEVTVASYRLPKNLQPGESYTLEFRLEGNKLTGLYNDAAVIELVDDHLPDVGSWGIYAKEGWYESVEYLSAGN